MDWLWILTLILLGTLAMLVFGYTVKTLWQFGRELKKRSPMLGLVWQLFWLIMLVLALTVIFLVTFAEYSDFKRAEQKKEFIKYCENVEKVEGTKVKAEYDRLKQSGMTGLESIRNISHQKNKMGYYINCIIGTNQMTAEQLDIYFDSFTH